MEGVGGAGFVIHHVVRHAEVVEDFRLTGQFFRAGLEQADGPGIVTAFEEDPAQGVRGGRVEGSQGAGLAGGFIGLVQQVKLFGVETRQIVQGDAEIRIDAQQSFVGGSGLGVISALFLNHAEDHQGGDVIRFLGEVMTEFSDGLVVFLGVDVEFSQQHVGGSVVWVQCNGLVETSLGLIQIGLRNQNLGEEGVEVGPIGMLVQFVLHRHQRRGMFFLVQVECYQLLEGGLEIRGEFVSAREFLPGFCGFILPQQQAADDKRHLGGFRVKPPELPTGVDGVGKVGLGGIGTGEINVSRVELRLALDQLGH